MYQSENAMIVEDALKRIDSIFHAKPLDHTKISEHPKDSSVELKQVSYSYDGEKNALTDVSLRIDAGQIVAFVGPSGGENLPLQISLQDFLIPKLEMF